MANPQFQGISIYDSGGQSFALQQVTGGSGGVGAWYFPTQDSSSGLTGTAVPTSAMYIAGLNAGNLVGVSVDATGKPNVNASASAPSDVIATGAITTTQNVPISTQGTSALMIQILGTWTGTVVFEVSLDGTTWDSANVYPVFPDAAPAVSSATANGFWTLSVGGVQQFRVRGNTVATGTANVTLTAGQGQYGVVAVSPVAANFNATVVQATAANLNATVVGTKTNNAAAPNGTNIGALTALANAANPTDTEGDLVLLSVDLSGHLRTLANQGTSPWVENLTQVAGVALGSTAVTNFGTAPAATAVPGVNASIYAGTTGLTATGSSLNANITNTVTVTGTVAVTQSTSPWVVAGGLTNNNAAPAANNVGVLPAIVASAPETYTSGDQALPAISKGGSTVVIPADEQWASSLSYFGADSGVTLQSIATGTNSPVISYETFNAANIYLLRRLTFGSNGSLFRWQLVKNATLTGSTFATTVGTSKIDTAATSFSAGTVVAQGYSGSAYLDEAILIWAAAGAPGDRFTIAIEPVGSGATKVVAGFNWTEQTAAI